MLFFFCFFLVGRKLRAPLNLTYPADENGEGEVPLVCLQHYQSAEPVGTLEPWGGGDIFARVPAHTHAHTHTPGLHATLCTGVWGRTRECTEPPRRPSRACVCLYICPSPQPSAVSVCLYLRVYAPGRRLESELKLSDISQGCAVWKKNMPA